MPQKLASKGPETGFQRASYRSKPNNDMSWALVERGELRKPAYIRPFMKNWLELTERFDSPEKGLGRLNQDIVIDGDGEICFSTITLGAETCRENYVWLCDETKNRYDTLIDKLIPVLGISNDEQREKLVRTLKRPEFYFHQSNCSPL